MGCCIYDNKFPETTGQTFLYSPQIKRNDIKCSRNSETDFFKIPRTGLLVLLIEVVLGQRLVNNIKEKNRQYTYMLNVARSLNIYTSFSISTV
jgi:hypothetical protein